MKPLNLPKAIKLPVKVSAPINTLSPMETKPVVSKLKISGFRANSPQATRAEAAPPKPLNTATNSGIAVICTFLASNRPIRPPTTIPPTINSNSTMSWSNKVTSTPISIPIAANWFPLRAVPGEFKSFTPRIKKPVATK